MEDVTLHYMEFHPQLSDRERAVNRATRSFTEEEKKEYVQDFLETDNFFQTLEAKNKPAWRNAIREFYKAVM